MRRNRAVSAALSAGIALAAGGCGGSAGRGASARPEGATSLAGVHWRLQAAEGPGGSTPFPKTVDGWLEASDTGAVTGSDGCAVFNGSNHAMTGGLRLSHVTEAASGCVDDSGPLEVMRKAVYQVLLSRHPARVTLTPNRLVVHGSRHVLIYVNAGPAQHGLS